MTPAFLFKLLILFVLLLIALSLSSGMLFLVRDKGKSNRTVQALTIRIILSIILFILLFVGFKYDLIRPHGVYPDQVGRIYFSNPS